MRQFVRQIYLVFRMSRRPGSTPAANDGTFVQLAAVGPQDAWLSDVEGSSLFFGPRERRAMIPFAVETVEQGPNAPFLFGQTNYFSVPTRGDLLGDLMLELHTPVLEPRLGVVPYLAPLPDDAFRVATSVPEASFAFPVMGRNLAADPLADWASAVLVDDAGGQIVEFADGDDVRVLRWASGFEVALFADRVAHVRGPGAFVIDGTPHRGPTDSRNAKAIVVSPIIGDDVATSNHTWPPRLAHALIEQIRLVLDNLEIHSQSRLYYDIAQLSTASEGHRGGLLDMLGGSALSLADSHTLYLPLRFACRASSPLPTLLLGLGPQLRVAVTTTSLDQLLAGADDGARWFALSTSTPELDARLLADLVFLDAAERADLLAKNEHTMLLEVARESTAFNYMEAGDGSRALSATVRVGLDHLNFPVKQLMFVAYKEAYDAFFQYAPSGTIRSGAIEFGSADLFDEVPGAWFSRVVPYEFGSRCDADGRVHVHSFSVRPDSRQPTGAWDFSKFVRANLRLGLDRPADDDPYWAGTPDLYVGSLRVQVLALGYNALIIKGGSATTLL